MENCCLAIPKVPIQQWNQTYDLATALAEGTIFPELNMPFFAAPEGSNTTLPKVKVDKVNTSFGIKGDQNWGAERNTVLSGVNSSVSEEMSHLFFTQICFALDDTLLYLDTHPEDEQAKQFYEQCLQKKKELLSENRCGCDCLTHFEWEKKPLVWEGGHC